MRMEEEKPEKQSFRPKLEEEEMVNVRIRMEPQSLVVQVPFKWEINQIKCLLCTMIPKLEFGMVQLTHLREDLPGHMTLDEVLTGDWEEQYMDRGQFELNFTRKDNKPQQFEKYYASKMIPLLTSLKKSPFQPVLHPKYSALMDELVQMQESSEGALRNNLQSLINLRKLLNIPNRNIQNQNNQEAEEAAMGNGLGALGPRPGNNANIFERGGFLVFKILQIFLLWQLISLVITNISAGHIFILLVIVVAYLCIDHFQKNKNNQNNQNNQNAQPQPERREGEEILNPAEQQLRPQQKANEESLEKKEEEAQEGSDPKEGETDQPYSSLTTPKQVPRWLFKSMDTLCLICESLVSFIMSLFPNWNIQFHNNIFRENFKKIDQVFQQWEDNQEIPREDLEKEEEKYEEEEKMQYNSQEAMVKEVPSEVQQEEETIPVVE